jgi:hypothetical protein
MNSRRRICSIALSVAAVLGLGWVTFAAEPAQAPSPGVQPEHSGIVPHADKLLTQVCQTLAAADAFSFHAEIIFDQVPSSDVKLQYAAAMDLTVQRPDELAVSYQSDLGAKRLWYNDGTLTVYDPPRMVYASVAVPSIIDGMLNQLSNTNNMTIPLSDFTASDPCELLRRDVIYGGYVGIGDVNGVECDHIALSSPKADLQLWLDRSGKPVPRKVVINYRSLPGSPEYIALLSDWKFPKELPASLFRPDLPKKALQIGLSNVKESKP